ncbi:MAG: TetR/AcrR family transcriptional regulator [Pseudomonadota bacterium]
MARTIAKDHDAKRAMILKAAAGVFAKEGYDRASVAQVAQACSISKASIYHYYTSKDDLLFGILDSHLSSLRDAILTLKVEGLAPEEALRATVRAYLLAYEGADNEHRVQTSGMAHLSAERQAVLRGHQKALVAHLSSIIASLAPEVFAGNAPKLRAATMSVFGMLNWFYMWNGRAGAKARRDYADTVTTLTARGVGGL